MSRRLARQRVLDRSLFSGHASNVSRIRTYLQRQSRGSWAATRANSIPLSFFAALTVLYTTLAVRRQIVFETAGWDLGIFVQAIRNYAALHPPIVILKAPGYNLLGDHFHPILVLIAPLYALFPSAMTLLVVQAVLFALACVPLVGWARRALGVRVAIVVGVVYGLSFGIASAVGFDFHEIAFAVPMIAFSLAALGQGRLTAAAAWALPLVLVKEDLGLTVVFVIGILIAMRGARRLGLITAAAGVVATALEVLVIIPHFNTSGSYAYWGKISTHSLFTVFFSSGGQKLLTLALTLGITGFGCLLSPIVLAALPSLLLRFASDDSAYWGTGYHYSAILMPIVVAAMIDALCRLRRKDTRFSRRASVLFLVASLTVSVALVPRYPLAQLVNAPLWAWTPRDASISRALAAIPNGTIVSASDDLVPQLTSRDQVTLFGRRPLSATRPAWIVADSATTRHFTVTDSRQQRDLLQAEASGYAVVIRSDGITLLRRDAP